MQLLSLYIENFMGNVKSELDLTSFKSCLIVGKNKNNSRESNGTGKSTIFKAIDFVLFGKYPGQHIDEIIRWGAEKCIVALVFQKGASIYRVTRSRHSKSELKLEEKAGDKWIPKGQRTSKQAANELSKLLGINYEAFKSSVLFAQGDLSGLAEATPDKRKAMLKEPLQLAIYSKFEEISKKKNKKLEEDLQLINNQLTTIGNPQQIIDEYSKKIEIIVKEVSGCKGLINEIKLKVNEKKQEKDKIARQLEGASESLGKMEVIETKKAAKTTVINKLVDQIEENKNSVKNKSISIREFKLSLKLLTDDLKEIESKQWNSEAEIEKKINELNSSEQKGINYLTKLQVQIDSCDHTLPGDEQCPQCKQNISDQYRDKFISDNIKLRKELVDSYKTYSFKLTKLQAKKSNLNKELKEIAASKVKITSLKSQIEMAEAKIASANEIIKQLNNTIKNAEDSLKINNKELQDLEKENKVIIKQLKNTNVPELQTQESILRKTLSELDKELNQALNNSSIKNRELGNAESTIDRAREDLRRIETYQKQKTSLTQQLKIQKRGTFAFSPKGIPTLIIHTILDDLQCEVNKLLQELRPELGMQFLIEKDDKDTLDIKFTVDGVEINYNLLSGGQKMYIALSLKMGLSLLIQNKLNVNINFLELDEVDQSLDKAGVDAFADVIKHWQDEFKIFVVTHNDSLKDKFSHAILVEKDQNGAKAKVVTQW